MLVPAEMEALHAMESQTVTGKATYTNVRRFETEAKPLGIR
jgi:hypothetical protein